MRELCRFTLRDLSTPKVLSHRELRHDCRKSHMHRQERWEEAQLQDRDSTANFETVE
jgi:hypothetical protein